MLNTSPESESSASVAPNITPVIVVVEPSLSTKSLVVNVGAVLVEERPNVRLKPSSPSFPESKLTSPPSNRIEASACVEPLPSVVCETLRAITSCFVTLIGVLPRALSSSFKATSNVPAS